ncbi:hypothetical protein BCD64_07770 [Nostoc sp. MBR 210]|nr:hypothetical protein BCD64_07770 [Nostoc sp. MBR 210]
MKINNQNCFKKLIAINGILEDVRKVLKDTKNPSPNFSPLRREALKSPHYLVGNGRLTGLGFKILLLTIILFKHPLRSMVIHPLLLYIRTMNFKY